jgi:hypothetical protein
MEPGKVVRAMILVSLSMLAVAAILFVQSKFDASDRKAAVVLVQQYHSKEGRTVPEVLDELHPGKLPLWSASTESACFQHVRVRAYVSGPDMPEAVAYDFVVDINGPSIHPGNPAGEKALGMLGKPRPADVAPPGTQSAGTGSAAAVPSATASAGTELR